MPPKKEIVGMIFGHWTVLEELPERVNGKIKYKVLCSCGKESTSRPEHLLSGNSKSCGHVNADKSKNRPGSSSPSWKGGRHLNSHGYVYVYDPKHPNSKSNGYVLEHRRVYSNYLGRPLLKSEQVHHVNGDKQDNRIENLELWSTSQPPGQRIEDKVQWALEILELYGDYKKEL